MVVALGAGVLQALVLHHRRHGFALRALVPQAVRSLLLLLRRGDDAFLYALKPRHTFYNEE